MAGAPDHLQFSSLSCKLSIIQAKNLEFKSTGTLFVRCYLSAGNNKRIRLNSREISCRSFLSWNESFLLDCVGTQDSMGDLMQENLVFELRWRNKVPIFGRIIRSKLLGRGEIPWKEVFNSPKMEMEKCFWVTMIPRSGQELLDEDVELPKLQVGMKVEVPAMAEKDRRRIINGNAKKWDDCGCGCKDGRGCSCLDYDVFALAAALEVFE